MTRRALLLSAAALPLLGQKMQSAPIEKIGKVLASLPGYGSFDFLTFKCDASVLTLAGYAVGATLKDGAELALKPIGRISKIVNEVEVLPSSPSDDRVRSSVFRAIYSDPALTDYAPGGAYYGSPLHRRRGGLYFGSPFERWDLPPDSLEPLGPYPIHILVKAASVILVGIVDRKSDSDRANLLANGVAGVTNVKNLLEVDRSQTSKKKKSI